MHSLIHDHFNKIEDKCEKMNCNDFLLWPTTEINQNIQKWIKKRYGCIDSIDIENSRPAIIRKKISELIDCKKIDLSFSMLDICCGDALILLQIKRFFPNCEAIGFDLNKNKFESHQSAIDGGVKLYGGFVQELFSVDLPFKMDVGIMLNTFRSWHTARLKDRDKDIPIVSKEWLLRNFKYLILTINNEQLIDIRANNYNVEVIGIGEEKSYFVCIETK